MEENLQQYNISRMGPIDNIPVSQNKKAQTSPDLEQSLGILSLRHLYNKDIDIQIRFIKIISCKYRY